MCKQQLQVSDTVKLQQLTIAEKLCTNICKDFSATQGMNKEFNKKKKNTRSVFLGGCMGGVGEGNNQQNKNKTKQK